MIENMRIIPTLVLLAFCGAAHAQLYRWTDEKGGVHLTDTPPPAGAKGVQKRAGPPPAAGAQEPFALQKARKEFPVTLYSTPGCESCDSARKLLNSRGIPFKEVSVTSNEQIEEFKKTVGSTSVPAIVIGSTVQAGFGELQYNRLLDEAGYPKLGELQPRNQGAPRLVQPAKEDQQEEETPARRGLYAPK